MSEQHPQATDKTFDGLSVEDLTLADRLAIAHNPNQGDTKRVLCVCTAGILRSPTAANVLHQAYGYNTRSAGAYDDMALIRLEKVLLDWADEIVCMEDMHVGQVCRACIDYGVDMDGKTLVCLDIPDTFSWNDDELSALIEMAYENAEPYHIHRVEPPKGEDSSE